MFRGSFAMVDANAISHNIKSIRSWIGDRPRLMIAVKANGYGHGDVQVAKVASQAGATDFGVASLEEALRLRRGGIEEPILILGPVSPQAAVIAAEHDIAITIHSPAWHSGHVPIFPRKLQVHLKYDTGMSRLGYQDVDGLMQTVRWLSRRSDIEWEGLFTHLACADDMTSTHSLKQIARFKDVIDTLERIGSRPHLIHASNSAGTLRDKSWQFDLVRVGISAYGYAPDPSFPMPFTPQPALSLYSFITRVVTIAPGETVGYGGTFKVQKPTRVATVPVGYADGYPRYLSNRAHVLVRGQRVKVIGNVCMDQLMLDVTELPDVQMGDCVTLYGHETPAAWTWSRLDGKSDAEQSKWLTQTYVEKYGENVVSLDELAEIGHTISYELMCALSPRVPRLYTEV